MPGMGGGIVSSEGKVMPFVGSLPPGTPFPVAIVAFPHYCPLQSIAISLATPAALDELVAMPEILEFFLVVGNSLVTVTRDCSNLVDMHVSHSATSASPTGLIVFNVDEELV
ncbi:hypothetical protein M7I_3585 [Glarea lozoyensis 74030]|uniref:Uncharacterized protein n=1 Tax=Glarea lozoyensis (strain ATCC 74030 / MF5533) TaxID=1104152 RepID=H0ELW2_GLAL7|nr:hypothetical protein M7I_3585 [Glarea lozoyensis 74030]